MITFIEHFWQSLPKADWRRGISYEKGPRVNPETKKLREGEEAESITIRLNREWTKLLTITVTDAIVRLNLSDNNRYADQRFPLAHPDSFPRIEVALAGYGIVVKL